MTRFLTAVSITAALVLPVGEARSDERTRERLKDQIERDIKSLNGDIEDLGDANKDAGDVRSVLSDLDDIAGLVGDLEEHAEGDTKAEDIVEDYPDLIGDLENALKALQDLKGTQFEHDAVPEFCEGLTKEFQSEVTTVLKNNGTERDLETEAKPFASDAEERIDAAEETLREAQAEGRSVTRFSPSKSPWRETGRALEAAVEGITDHLESAFAQVTDACGPLVEWEDLDFVEEAVTIINDQAGAIQKFLKDGEEWFDDTRGINDRVCFSLEIVRDAYCQYDWEEAESMSKAKALYDRLANSASRDVIVEVDELLRRYERELQGRGQALRSKDKDAERLYLNMNKRYQGLKKLKSGDDLKGARNPKTQTWIRYGVQQHNTMTNRYRCNIADKPIPGASGHTKPDCILLDGCEIVEFKPNTPSGLKAGGKVRSHLSQFNRWAERRAKALIAAGTPIPAKAERTNMSYNDEFVLQAMAHECIEDDGVSTFSSDVETYEPCTKEALKCPEID